MSPSWSGWSDAGVHSPGEDHHTLGIHCGNSALGRVINSTGFWATARMPRYEKQEKNTYDTGVFFGLDACRFRRDPTRELMLQGTEVK